MEPKLRRFPKSLLSQDVPPDISHRGPRVVASETEWPWNNAGREEHWPPQSFTPQARSEFNAVANTPFPPETPMGNQIGLQDIIRMQEFQDKLGPPQDAPPPSPMRAMPELPPANIPAPEPQGYGGPLPEISIDQFGPKPTFNAGISLPTNAGGLSVDSSFTSPEEWKAMLKLRRQF